MNERVKEDYSLLVRIKGLLKEFMEKINHQVDLSNIKNEFPEDIAQQEQNGERSKKWLEKLLIDTYGHKNGYGWKENPFTPEEDKNSPLVEPKEPNST